MLSRIVLPVALVMALWPALASVIIQEPTVPPASGSSVDFSRDVHAVLHEHCVKCHGEGRQKGGLRVDSREALLQGGDSGPAIVPGDSAQSLLITLVSGLDPERVMPAKGPRLEASEISRLRTWIDDGARWEHARSDRPARTLRPLVRMETPPGTSTHAVDRVLDPYLQAHGVEGDPVDDLVFARRVHLDVVGALPTPHELRSFRDDTRPDRRRQLVRKLLSENRRYAEHWISFWNDALRNEDRGTGYIDGGRRSITPWLMRALEENLPFDHFVGDLLTGRRGAGGFIRGIVWRGTVNASQVPPMQAAQNVAQVFLGVNLKCASCHDSFIDDWKLSEAYALASVFSDDPLEMHRCNEGTGEVADPAFLWPELGGIDRSLPRSERLDRLATIVTGEGNPRLARTIVNRLWARFLGRGLVEPVDDLAQEPWSSELLDTLAAELIDSGHDLKHVIELILTSRAYQLPSVGSASSGEFVFRGPEVRRMTAEQFGDALGRLTGPVPGPLPARSLPALIASDPERLLFRSGRLKEGRMPFDVDVRDATTLWLVVTNGGDGGNHDWANWAEPELVAPGKVTRLIDLDRSHGTTGHGEIRENLNVVGKPMRLAGEAVAFGIGTHAHSVVVYDLPPGTERFRGSVGPDQQAVDEGGEKGHSIEFLILTDVVLPSSSRPADALMRAMGRPIRDQVVTRRDSEATTLQALELTNGSILADRLKGGARQWCQRASEPQALIQNLYAVALGREPRAAEMTLARELVGAPPQPTGVEDLMWILLMLPEFQLIY